MFYSLPLAVGEIISQAAVEERMKITSTGKLKGPLDSHHFNLLRSFISKGKIPEKMELYDFSQIL